MHSRFEILPGLPLWELRIVARLAELNRGQALAPEQAQERAALSVQVGHITTGVPVTRALPCNLSLRGART